MDLKKVLPTEGVYFVTFLRMLLVPLISLILIKISHMAYLSADAPKIMLIVFLGGYYAFGIDCHTDVSGVWQ